MDVMPPRRRGGTDVTNNDRWEEDEYHLKRHVEVDTATDCGQEGTVRTEIAIRKAVGWVGFFKSYVPIRKPRQDQQQQMTK